MTQDNNYEDSLEYQVVVNLEEQYSIWPTHKEIPSGWRAEGPKGTKALCLEYIDKTWTDMRPLSLRQKMDSTEGCTAHQN